MKNKLADTETLLRDVLETVNEGVVIFDTDDRLVVCNARYREIYARVADKLVPGTHCADIFRAWGAQGLFSPRHGSVEDQVGQQISRHQNPNGPFELHTIEHSLRVEERVTDAGYTIGTHTDITAWKRMERAFQDYEGQIFQSGRRSADRFWTMDKDLRFATLVDYPNSSIIESPNGYIGHTRWEAVGVDPNTDEVWRDHRDDLLARRVFDDFRYTSEDGYGGIYHMSVSGRPVFGDDGEFAGYQGTTTRVFDDDGSEAIKPQGLRAVSAR